MSDIRFNGWLHRSGTGGVWQDSSGNVGIGSSVPSNPATSANPGILNVGVVTATTYYGSGANLTGIDGTQIVTGNTKVETIDTGSDGHLKFTTEGTERVRITGDGLGINVTPNRELHVKGLDAIVRVESTSATGRNIIEFFDSSAAKGSIGWPASGNDHMAIQQSENADMWFSTNDTERIRVSAAGSLGINNSDPQHPVHIKQAMSSSPYYINCEVTGTNTTGGGAGIAFDTSATNAASNNGLFLASISGERSASANGSNSLIFKTSKANVNGDGSLASGPGTRVVITEDGHTLFSGLTSNVDTRNAAGITIKSASGISFRSFGANGSRNWRVRPDDLGGWADLDFSCAPTDGGTDIPDVLADCVLSLQGDTKDVVVSNGDLFFGTAGKGIVLGATSNVDANTLEDYEEGTFDPTIDDESDFSEQNHHYIKIGSWVNIFGNLRTAGSVSGTGSMGMTGLPFTSANLSNMHWVGTIGGDNGWSTVTLGGKIASIPFNSTTCHFYKTSGDTVRYIDCSSDVGPNANLMYNITYKAA